MPVPVKVPVPVEIPVPYPAHFPFHTPTTPHPTLLHHRSPSPYPQTPQYVPTTPRLQVFPHPESALPHIHSTTARPNLRSPIPFHNFQSTTPHHTPHSPTPTTNHISHSPSPTARSFSHSPTPTPTQLSKTSTVAPTPTATPRIDSDVLDPARAALVERFNTQLQQKSDKEVSRRKRGVVFPDETKPSKVERRQRKAVPQDRLRPDATQILGGTVNLSGPRRPNFSLHSVSCLLLCHPSEK